MRRTPFSTLAAAVAVTVPLLAGAGPASAASPYERGPAPTTASVEAERGPFAVAQTSVSGLATPGFGSATITYPTTTTAGTFGGVAISPGFTASESTIAWLGPRLASQGFVVITFNTNSRYDQPAARGDQLLAALDYLTNSSSVRSRVDRTRLAVVGHSMGGGGALEAAKDRPSLQAAVPLTGWNTDKTWPEVTTPTLLVGAEADTVAPVGSHSIPFYTSLSNAQEKAYVELNNASHFAPNSPSTTLAKYTVSWLKRFVDDDTRYSQFLCPGPTVSSFGAVSDYRSTCAM
jgi:predicted dienelactone hydrolase